MENNLFPISKQNILKMLIYLMMDSLIVRPNTSEEYRYSIPVYNLSSIVCEYLYRCFSGRFYDKRRLLISFIIKFVLFDFDASLRSDIEKCN